MTPHQAGFEAFAVSEPVERLFFALLPDAVVQLALAQTAAKLCGQSLRGRRIAPERYHVTLSYLGEHAGRRPQIEACAIEAAGSVRADAFTATLDVGSSFCGRVEHPWVLRPTHVDHALHALRNILSKALATNGCARLDVSRFEPHLTIAYDEAALPPQPVEPIVWAVEEFA
ncbi:MAG: 2'-5' RNA ligase family protein, partial [Luteimonas sp.]